MSDYIVNDSHLTDIADAIRSKSGSSAALEFPTDFISAINGLSGMPKIYSGTVTANTSSTSNVTVGTINITMPSDFDPHEYLVYVKIFDTQYGRAGRFYGSDNFLLDPQGATGSARGIGECWRMNSDYSIGGYAQSLASGYGVYASAMRYNSTTKTFTITISARYSSSYSLTINATYQVDVYLIPSWRFPQ